jgi:hypothetical protein
MSYRIEYLSWSRKFVINPIKLYICKHVGHDWETYTVSTGYYSYDIEQAGYCLRCGWDTHGEYKRNITIKGESNED